MIETLPKKDPEEEVILGLNFSKRLAAGETISAAVSTVHLMSGTDPDVSSMVMGPADLTQSPMVRQKIKGGVDKARYMLRIKLTTNQRVIVGAGIFGVELGGVI